MTRMRRRVTPGLYLKTLQTGGFQANPYRGRIYRQSGGLFFNPAKILGSIVKRAMGSGIRKVASRGVRRVASRIPKTMIKKVGLQLGKEALAAGQRQVGDVISGRKSIKEGIKAAGKDFKGRAFGVGKKMVVKRIFGGRSQQGGRPRRRKRRRTSHQRGGRVGVRTQTKIYTAAPSRRTTRRARRKPATIFDLV